MVRTDKTLAPKSKTLEPWIGYDGLRRRALARAIRCGGEGRRFSVKWRFRPGAESVKVLRNPTVTGVVERELMNMRRRFGMALGAMAVGLCAASGAQAALQTLTINFDQYASAVDSTRTRFWRP